MKILLTGGNGQLGREVTEIFSRRHEVLALGRDELDVTDSSQVQACVTAFRPDVVLHAAAYTNVDAAETHAEEAYRVNAIGTRNLAVACEGSGAKLIYISTDYVFDGQKDTPYHEFDPVAPLSVYGRSKLAGEQLVQSLCRRYFIVRTSWVYGKYGRNFVKTMLQKGQPQSVLRVVHDQVGSPTYVADLANFLEELMQTDRYGVYHASNAGFCSWYEFACAIFAEFGCAGVEVSPCTTADYPAAASRPANSRLDHLAIRLNGFHDLPHWRDGLARYRAAYVSNS